MNTKPSGCCKPDCFNCPYQDCIYDDMEINDYRDGKIIDEFANPTPQKVLRNREYQRKYRERKPDEIKKRRLAFYKEHSASRIMASNQWICENRDRVNASKRAKYAENPEYYRQKQRDYRARKRAEKENAEGKETIRVPTRVS